MKKAQKKKDLERLGNSVIDDIEKMPDDEILQHAIDTFGGLEQVVMKFNSIVEQAECIARKEPFEKAKMKLVEDRQSPPVVSNIITLPTERKKEILEMVQSNKGITTLAARNATNRDADIDSELDDLIELGVIDENGNLL